MQADPAEQQGAIGSRVADERPELRPPAKSKPPVGYVAKARKGAAR